MKTTKVWPVCLGIVSPLLGALGFPPRVEADEFPMTAFLQQKTSDGEERRFPWPAPERFRATFEKSPEKSPLIRLVRGVFSRTTPAKDEWESKRGGRFAGVVALWEHSDGVAIFAVDAKNGEALEALEFALDGPERWSKQEPGAEPSMNEHLVLISGQEHLDILPDYVSEVSPPERGVWLDWTYSTTLLDSSQPLHDPIRPQDSVRGKNTKAEDHFSALNAAVAAGEMSGAEAALRVLLDSEASAYDDRWLEHREFFESRRPDLAWALYRRYRPMGRCSMDNRPQAVAREYAEFCFRQGKLACFLELQVRIMGDYFERVAYSSYGEEAHETEAARLQKTGLDADRFLRGLLVQFAGAKTRIELHPWRLSRSLVDLFGPEQAREVLTRLAQAPELDEYNRFRATITLAYALLREDRSAAGRARAASDLGGLSLSPLSRAWALRFGQPDPVKE